MKKITAFIIAACITLPVALKIFPTGTKAEAALIVGEEGSYDVVVYGATSAGVTAAIAAKREGADVLLVSQTSHLGGLTSSGLGATDMANKNVVGGISWEFYNRIYEYYKDDAAWVSETRDDYFGLGIDGAIYGGKSDSLGMQWVFEPKVAFEIFEEMLIDEGVPVIFDEPIDLTNGVVKADGRITEIVSESGKRFQAKVFIDCSYEGDLMAEAGVTYTVGREANSEYGETMNGILPNDNEYENVSPYIVEGDPDSGLLPFIEDSSLGLKGDADGRVQAYCFRFTLTTDPENMIPISKPENYHPEWYETRARILQANPNAGCELTQNRMPNNKTDTNHADFVGMSYEYADGDYLSRKNIEDDHRDYALGLLYFYAYDERVPLSVREEMRKYGLAKDEFTDNGNFPVQIYLREGRRMVSDYVMKESDVISASVPGVIAKTTAPHSVGQGFYWFDSHRVAYYKVTSSIGDGYQTDGNFWSSRRDYPISYESIRPKKEECTNLYVPVCLSSTHAAYGSIRMETTYMILGESAGTAAAMSAAEMESDPDFCVQELEYTKLAIKLAENGQLLGDIVVDDLSSGEISVLRLNVLGLIDGETAEVLYTAMKEGIDTSERVDAVRQTLVAAANRIVPGTSSENALTVLNKFGIISNTAAWEKLFSDTPPATLVVGNVTAVFDKVTAFFANESTVGYITDWVNYFYDNGIINEELRAYFDDHAVAGRTCSGERVGAIAVAIARTLDPSVTDGNAALQIFINTGITSNSALWQPVFNAEKDESGGTVGTLLKNVYVYLTEHEALWKDIRIGVAEMDRLAEKGIVSEQDYANILRATAEDASLVSEAAKKVIVNAARYFAPSATEDIALDVLSELGVEISGVVTAMDGNSVSGVAMKSFLLSLAEKVKNTPVVEPLPSEIMQSFLSLGLVSAEDATYFDGNAVSGGNVNGVKLIELSSRISARISAEGTTSIEKLLNVGILDEESAAALSDGGETVSGGIANRVIRNLYVYVSQNNEKISDEYLQILQKENIVTVEEAELAKTDFSRFGSVDATFAESVFIKMARRIDKTVSSRSDALAVLQSINAVSKTETWEAALSGDGKISGLDGMNIVNIGCKFISEILADYEYLAEKGYITEEAATYFILHGNNSNKASGTKIVELLIALAKPLDSSVADGTTAVAVLKSNGIVGNDAVWLAIVDNPESEVTVVNLVNLIDKITDKIRQLDAAEGEIAELPDKVLAWFVEKGYIKEGNYGASYFKENAKVGGGTLNQGETQNMLIRAFRGVTGLSSATGTTLTNAITASGFTFSDDETENGELSAYWYARIETKNPVDGEMLRVLMVRIYEYMNKEAEV